MAQNQKRNNYNNDSKAQKRPVKQDMTFPLVSKFTTYDRRNDSTQEVDYNSVIIALQVLHDNGSFDLLTQNVSMSRALMNNDPNANGNAIVGFIKDFDFSGQTPMVTLTIYGASVAGVQDADNAGANLHLEPRLVCNQGKFKCFNGFFLISDN